MILFLLAAAIVPTGVTFTCTPTRVWDGDGPIWCAEGPRVRLAGIAAPEIDGTCRSDQPCPSADAKDARDALVRLLGEPAGQSPDGHVLVQGAAMNCLSVSGAGGSRTAAWCISPRTGDLSCAMVSGGWSLVWPRYWQDHKCNK